MFAAIHIRALLDAYTLPDPPAVSEAAAELLVWNGLLERRVVKEKEMVPGCGRITHTLTPRGEAYVRSLFDVPLPVSQWVTPWPKEPTRHGDPQ